MNNTTKQRHCMFFYCFLAPEKIFFPSHPSQGQHNKNLSRLTSIQSMTLIATCAHAAAYCRPFNQTHERMWNQKSFTSSWSSICSFSFSTIWLWWLISSSFSGKDTHGTYTVFVLFIRVEYRYFLHCQTKYFQLHVLSLYIFSLHLPMGYTPPIYVNRLARTTS